MRTSVWNIGLCSSSINCSISSNDTSILFFWLHSMSFDLKLTSLRDILSSRCSLENLLFHELLATVVALVQINGADEGFECIAVHVTVVGRGAGRVFHQFVQSDFHGQFVERFALYNFRAGVGKETLAASFKVAVYNVSYNSVEDGISQNSSRSLLTGRPFRNAGRWIYAAKPAGKP